MFGLFKKKSKIDKLNDLYEKLLEDAHRYSKTDRKLSDETMAEAEAIRKQIEALEAADK